LLIPVSCRGACPHAQIQNIYAFTAEDGRLYTGITDAGYNATLFVRLKRVKPRRLWFSVVAGVSPAIAAGTAAATDFSLSVKVWAPVDRALRAR